MSTAIAATIDLGSSDTLSARVVIRGDGTEPIEQIGAHFDEDEMGVFSGTRKVRIRRDLLAAWLPRKGDIDGQFPFLRLWKLSTDRTDGAFDTVTLHFNGFRVRHPEPVEVIERDRIILDSTIYHADHGSLTMRYLSPQMTVKYALDREPEAVDPYTSPRAREFREPIKLLSLVNPSTGTEITGPGVRALLSLFKWEVRSIITRQPVVQEGELWRCTDVIERVVVQSAFLDTKLIGGVLGI